MFAWGCLKPWWICCTDYFSLSEHEYSFIPFLEVANIAPDGWPVTVRLCEAPLESLSWKNTVNTFICKVLVRLDFWSFLLYFFFPNNYLLWCLVYISTISLFSLFSSHTYCYWCWRFFLTQRYPSLCPLPSTAHMRRESRICHFKVIIFNCEFPSLPTYLIFSLVCSTWSRHC